MNSIKSAFTVLFLLVVSYGVYRLIHTPDPLMSNDGEYFIPVNSSESSDADGQKKPSLFESISGAIHNWTTSSPTNPPKSTENGEQQFSAEAIPAWSGGSDNRASLTSANQVDPATGGRPSTTDRIGATSFGEPAPLRAPAISAPELSTGPGKDAPVMTGPLTPVATSESPSAPPVAPMTSVPSAAPAVPLASAWPQVDGHLRKGEIAGALKLLSSYYNAPLADAERAELLRWLDALAFKVIYSTEHQLSPVPHVVQSGETLDSIARNWNVPKQLILNINRSKIPQSNELSAGLELKIVRGPFRAEIDRQRSELTLFLGEHYAGRFPIDTSSCQSLAAGSLRVSNMTQDSSGAMALELSNGIKLCAAGSAGSQNAIVLNANDARDLFSILSADSQVAVIR